MTVRKINSIVVAGALILGGGFAGLLLLPGLKDLHRRRAEINQKAEEVRQHQTELGSVSELYGEIMALGKRTSDYRKELPAERQFGEFLGALSDALRRVGVEQSVVQPRSEERLEASRIPSNMKLAQATRILPVQVSFDGNFGQTFDFLRAVEELPRLSHVQSLEISNDEHSPSHVHVDLTLMTYYFPDDEGTKL
ncbi:MAG TPA: type 4a pilus biogenesis protein PilO [Phycisphaerae bacterium]|nr:type 4a pilus biogenesis protein PilO [Phycisphaerae bacterium]